MKLFFFKTGTAYAIRLSLVGSEMCIREGSTCSASVMALKPWVGHVPNTPLSCVIRDQHVLQRKGPLLIESIRHRKFTMLPPQEVQRCVASGNLHPTAAADVCLGGCRRRRRSV